MRVRIAALLIVSALFGVAHAVPVDPVAPSGIAAMISTYRQTNDSWVGGALVLCTTGQVVWLDAMNDWLPVTPGTPSTIPVPIVEVADWGPAHLKTTSGDFYVFTYGRTWERVGGAVVPSPCVPTVSNETKALGGVKSLFR